MYKYFQFKPDDKVQICLNGNYLKKWEFKLNKIFLVCLHSLFQTVCQWNIWILFTRLCLKHDECTDKSWTGFLVLITYLLSVENSISIKMQNCH